MVRPGKETIYLQRVKGDVNQWLSRSFQIKKAMGFYDYNPFHLMNRNKL